MAKIDHMPLVVRDEIGTYCACNIQCSDCANSGTEFCPNTYSRRK